MDKKRRNLADLFFLFVFLGDWGATRVMLTIVIFLSVDVDIPSPEQQAPSELLKLL